MTIHASNGALPQRARAALPPLRDFTISRDGPLRWVVRVPASGQTYTVTPTTGRCTCTDQPTLGALPEPWPCPHVRLVRRALARRGHSGPVAALARQEPAHAAL